MGLAFAFKSYYPLVANECHWPVSVAITIITHYSSLSMTFKYTMDSPFPIWCNSPRIWGGQFYYHYDVEYGIFVIDSGARHYNALFAYNWEAVSLCIYFGNFFLLFINPWCFSLTLCFPLFRTAKYKVTGQILYVSHAIGRGIYFNNCRRCNRMKLVRFRYTLSKLTHFVYSRKGGVH